MAVKEVKVGKCYKWAEDACDENHFVIKYISGGIVNYSYPDWKNGKGYDSSIPLTFMIDPDRNIVEFEPTKQENTAVTTEEVVREVKVGQVWKWYEWSEGSFEVLEIKGSAVDIRYLDSGDISRILLSYWDDQSVLVEDVPVEGEPIENNSLSPNVYQFPNGVEVKDISAHLTSFGGQAVQYIARATRLDGVVKGLPVQDLHKAIELLKWEAERLEALEGK